MKQLYIITVFLLLTAYGCTRTEYDSIFSETQDTRITKALDKIQADILSSPYGWNAILTASDSLSQYGYWFKFYDSNRVVSRTTNPKAFTSSYRLKMILQPEIIFDTHSYIHQDVDRNNTKTDFEFEVRSSNSDSISLVGRFNKSILMLYKADAGDSASFPNKFANIYQVSGNIKLFTGADTTGTPTIRPITGVKPVGGLFPLRIFNYADLGINDWQYVLLLESTRTAITGVKSVDINATMKAGITEGSFTVYSAHYNTALKQIYLKTGYKNTAGAARLVEETLQLP
mgnify:CR=1 FL=1